MQPQKSLPRVLIVDDDQRIQNYLAALLRKHGYDPVAAGAADCALELIETGCIDLTISDILMPGMDGLDLLQQIKAINPAMPVAIMTGLGTADNAIAALNRGAFNFITKPFRHQEILKVVRRGLTFREPFRHAAELLEYGRLSVRHNLPSNLALVQPIASQLAELAVNMGYFLDARKMEFRLVVDELVANAMVHGNRQDASKRVLVELTIDRERLVLVVEDQGQGFRPDLLPDPREGEGLLRCHGRGVLLCRMYMDELIYHQPGNRVTAIAYAANHGPTNPDTRPAHAAAGVNAGA